MKIKDVKANSIFKPGEGIHAWSFPQTSIIDWFFTLCLVLIIAGIITGTTNMTGRTEYNFGLAFLYTSLAIIPVFIFIHWIFGIKTRGNVWLGIA
jgi:hypothetical protein